MPSTPPKEKVLEFVKMYGPTIPLQIKKALGGELLFIGAVLSELSSSGKIKSTYLKYGGTPFYYYPGQEHRLVGLIKYMNEKDQRTALLLKEKKILRDSELTPLQRVSIRTLKDFAIPIMIEIAGREELFWKWYLTSDDEALRIIKERLGIRIKEEEGGETRVEERVGEERVEKKERREVEKKVVKTRAKRLKKEELIMLARRILEERKARILDVLSTKPSEADFIVELPTSMGNARYFCRIKAKKTINDGDLASAFLIANSKKMPLLFIALGNITKKARELARKEFPGAVIVENPE